MNEFRSPFLMQKRSRVKPLFLFCLLAAFGAAVTVIYAGYLRKQTTLANSPGPVPLKSAQAPHTQSIPAPVAVRKRRADERELFRLLLNTNLSVSTTSPNVALLLDATGPGSSLILNDQIQGNLSHTSGIHFVGNLADIAALKSHGLFDQLYASTGNLLQDAANVARVDYIMVGKGTYAFRRQSSTDDPDLLNCDLVLNCRLFDRSGSMVQAETFSTTGPAYTENSAFETACERIAESIQKQMLNSIHEVSAR